MFYKSIRARLQLWYGLLLLVVLAGLGITAHRLNHAGRLQRIDTQLQQRAGHINGALRRGSPERGGPGGPGGSGPDRGGPDRFPPPGERRGDRDDGRQPPLDFQLSKSDINLIEGGTNGFYFLLWHRDGQVMARSDSAPKDVPRAIHSKPDNFIRERGIYREFVSFTPPGECILIGRNMTNDIAEMRQVTWTIVGIGAVVLALGLAGGWWIADRVMKPIEDISATAVKIAAGDLSQRIDIADTNSELGRLASVLNSTFARLDAAFEQQGRFTADAAHELRTPISVMLTQTQIALTRDRSVEEYRETIEICERAIQRMRRLIELLLELARLDAGQETMRRFPFDLSKIAGDCVELLRPLADVRHVQIECELVEAKCQGDAERIAQVITNLVTNAIHHNKENGNLRIETQMQNGMATLIVSDTGMGIPAGDLPYIFERFYRGDKSRSSATGRTGLGLAISKAIVEAHGGEIGVTSQLGKGATFIVRLPVNKAK